MTGGLPYSRGEDLPDGRRFAHAAGRNLGPIRAVLAATAPQRGRALEIASGTGQHVAELALAFRGLDWQPSDSDPGSMGSIAAWAARSGAANIRPPLVLDACAPGWGAAHGGFDLILVVNLLHLIPVEGAITLLVEAAQALAPGGLLAIYGPFLRGGQAISPGDAAFHASLSAHDPRLGYKDRDDVLGGMAAAGLVPRGTHAMPANNLFLLAARPDTSI